MGTLYCLQASVYLKLFQNKFILKITLLPAALLRAGCRAERVEAGAFQPTAVTPGSGGVAGTNGSRGGGEWSRYRAYFQRSISE